MSVRTVCSPIAIQEQEALFHVQHVGMLAERFTSMYGSAVSSVAAMRMQWVSEGVARKSSCLCQAPEQASCDIRKYV